MSSLHERHFKKRWYGFVPRSSKAAIVSILGFLLIFGCIGASLLLSDRYPWTVWLQLPGVAGLLIWVGLGLARSDW